MSATFNVNRSVMALGHIAAGKGRMDLGMPETLRRIWLRDGTAEVADGYVYARINLGESLEGVTASIPAEEAVKAMRKTTHRRPEVVVTVEDAEEGETVRMAAEAKPSDIFQADVKPLETELPRPDHLIHNRVPRATTINNPPLLKKVLALVEASTAPGEPTEGIELRVFGPGEAIQIRATASTGEEIEVALMPMVSDKWNGEPVEVDVSRHELPEYHLRKALLGGRAGVLAQRLEEARVAAEAKDEADPLLSDEEVSWMTDPNVSMDEVVERRLQRMTIIEAMLAAGISEDDAMQAVRNLGLVEEIDQAA